MITFFINFFEVPICSFSDYQKFQAITGSDKYVPCILIALSMGYIVSFDINVLFLEVSAKEVIINLHKLSNKITIIIILNN